MGKNRPPAQNDGKGSGKGGSGQGGGAGQQGGTGQGGGKGSGNVGVNNTGERTGGTVKQK